MSDCDTCRAERERGAPESSFDLVSFLADPRHAGFAEMFGNLLRGIASAQDCELWVKRKHHTRGKGLA